MVQVRHQGKRCPLYHMGCSHSVVYPFSLCAVLCGAPCFSEPRKWYKTCSSPVDCRSFSLHFAVDCAVLRYPSTKGIEHSTTMYMLAPFGKMEVAFLLLLLTGSLGGIGAAPVEAPEVCLLQSGSMECSPGKLI
ncbi:uncharacterized protein LOC115483806 [Drosophila hydei]|uniref:Uncharacterized protein LOC115483806 n=1 Tax=Drosophila hydei TaxID=7224 RepID=A0A6J2SXV4_DROHY|nr:uncharacterized protein LOC115483806 [Drosophila hydei]